MSEPLVRVARFLERTTAEGPGERTAIWVQGCSIRCPGCFNPHLFGSRGGTLTSPDDLVRRVLAAGSANQEFVHLTDRLRDVIAPDRLEATVTAGGTVAVNGWASPESLDALLAELPHRRSRHQAW
ncbi:4Fe-4S cluster-binding domain-containing protein [Actinoplanes sp. NPDC023801]|uniref:4Fe-4S cluster-binding domain-containing protein n=1 Tax=Actinoplanes sp. NPDC023801 TaxID=3154595 RepID=UPI00340DBC89